MEVQIQKIALLSALFFASYISRAEQAVPRKYYGSKLEPMAHVLHGAGQGNVADVQSYRTALGSYTNVLFMEYCSVHLAPGQYAEKLKTKLRDLSGFTAVQLGLKMGMNHPGSDKAHTHYEQDVADGKYDGQLTEFFNQLKALDVPFYIRIGYECNGSWNGYAPEPYKKAFIHITKLIRTSGLNAATVWCVFPDALDKLMTFYPGDEWVDWWAFDPFTIKNMESARPFIAEADRHHKPVMIGESTPRNVGVLEGAKSWDAWFVPFFRMIHENPGIKAFCYINWDWSNYPQWRTWGDARLQQNEVVATRYREELANPLYLHGTTAGAFYKVMTPLLSTSQKAASSLNVRYPGASIALSDQGQIVSWLFTEGGEAVPITARSELSDCKAEGAVTREPLPGGGFAFSRTVKDAKGHVCEIRERFKPTTNSIRWELELVSTNSPWSTDIHFRLNYLATAKTRFWTSWLNGSTWEEKDAASKTNPVATLANGKIWGDPLVPLPMMKMAWGYGEGVGNICLPLASLLEPERDRGVSLIVSPDQTLIKMQLLTTAEGELCFKQSYLRLGEGRTVSLAADIVAHEADWRGGLRWMVARYPQYFDPPNARVTELEGTASYSNWRRPFKPEEISRLKRMAYRTQWVATFDWPYYVMYMPPMPDDDATWESCGHDSSGRSAPNPQRLRKVSYRLMNEECRNFKNAGFHALSYFMLNEFGSDIVGPEKIRKELPASESWKDANTMLYRNFPNAILLNADGNILPKSWSRSVVMDPGEPNFHNYILEQARLTAERLPDSEGICIDRMDRLTLVNMETGADDRAGWYHGRPGRSQGIAWREIMSKIGPMFHSRDKFIFANPAGWGYHLEWFKELDGIYDEFGYRGGPGNGSALLGLRKPVFLWTENTQVKKRSADDTAPDLFFQRHLYLGAYPSAPLEGNDHLIRPNPEADQHYLDYGPLMDVYRGKKWVLAPHCVEVAGEMAKANLFAVPGGYALPVVFGSTNTHVRVSVRNIPDMAQARCFVLWPGVEGKTPVNGTVADGALALDVPLRRGCAMIQLLVRKQESDKNRAGN